MADIYERVRERLDMFPQGFPKTASGVELEILRYLFTPEDAEVMLVLRPAPELPAVVAGRMSRDAEAMAKQLYDMSKKGLIGRFRTPDGQYLYGLAPWIVGIWEFQLNNLDKKLTELKEKFAEEGMIPERRKTKLSGMRTIPIEKEIMRTSEIESYEKVSEIIDSHTKFAVSDCICRKERKIMGEGCDKLMEACMTFGPAAEYYIENGIAREITREEAREIIKKAEEQGLVHCSANQKGQKMFICNCCGCCCGVLRSVNKHNIPSAMTRANYYAKTNPEACTGCETCVDRCQVHAIEIQDGIAVIDKAKCIGCGLCASTCPPEAISMIRREKGDLSEIFPDPLAMVRAIGKEKGKVFPFE